MVSDAVLKHATKLLNRNAWYVGRFMGCVQMLRSPKLYSRDEVIEQMLDIADDWERDQQERDKC